MNEKIKNIGKANNELKLSFLENNKNIINNISNTIIMRKSIILIYVF